MTNPFAWLIAGAVIVVGFMAGYTGSDVAGRYILPTAAEGPGGLPWIEGRAETSGPARAGQPIDLIWTVTRRVPCPGTTQRAWLWADGEGRTWQIVEPLRESVAFPPDGAPPDAPFIRRVPTVIPVEVPPGEVTLQVTVRLDCGAGERVFRLAPLALTVHP